VLGSMMQTISETVTSFSCRVMMSAESDRREFIISRLPANDEDTYEAGDE
jgi:hypothetical protein